ncbi:DUF7553 family protein [Natrarchaeobius chitinivorans]|uniref:Uncharacterized protein n=1 Tax=Natrarchaeobius chitinivorans TaxID=1679083 RepID=A0A3N6MDJ2_NATCH|nr:hypothetical protein [Natrarchaeobius chitinivorans]RQG94700.1 hypothetical protein EA473_11285 [Natrarchaeobius chitinivorans]
MTQKLRQARSELEDAVERADDDVRDDLRETAAAFAEYASDDTDPDHAVFDDHLNTLRQARERATGDVEARIDRALERAEEYREGLEQA